MTRAQLVVALEEAGGNLAAAGRALGISRERVRQLVVRWEVTEERLSPSEVATIAATSRWRQEPKGDAA